MPLSNFDRMIQLADEVFATKDDPDQLDIHEGVLEHLQRIHPATVSEHDDGKGPVAWILLIPTTLELMHQFLSGAISEKALYDLTPLDTPYEALYLCSAMVLEEYRRKGIAKQLTLDAVASIRKDHNLKALFAWAFTTEGQAHAEVIAKVTELPLYLR